MTELIQELRNHLLATIDPEDLEALSGDLEPVTLEKGSLLYEPGDEVQLVYFPHNAVVSLMTLMRTGEAIESATVGREGAVGLTAFRIPHQSWSRAIVQVGGEASRIEAARLREALAGARQFPSVIDRHSQALFGHVAQSVACNALHSVEARFCRWLLSCRDRISTDRISLTQEFLADMLGVQRTTVTVVARTLQASGLIRYSRGVVDILDRQGLEASACECYRVVRRHYERLLPGCFEGASPQRV